MRTRMRTRRMWTIIMTYTDDQRMYQRRGMIQLDEQSEVFPLFQHSSLEFLYMLKGEVIYRHGARTYRLRPGDSLFFDADAPHGPEELIKLPIRFLSIIVEPRFEE